MICREICKLLLFTFLHFTLLPFQANCSSPQMEMERLCKLQLSPLEGRWRGLYFLTLLLLYEVQHHCPSFQSP